jgi:hypothetical protein
MGDSGRSYKCSNYPVTQVRNKRGHKYMEEGLRILRNLTTLLKSFIGIRINAGVFSKYVEYSEHSQREVPGSSNSYVKYYMVYERKVSIRESSNM